MPDTKETFPRGPSNEQTLLTELGAARRSADAANSAWRTAQAALKIVEAERDEARRQLAEIKEIDAKMCADYSKMVEQLAEAQAERDKLQAFKDWCHSYLDTHGVPHHPPGTHGAEGCRIGDRMDWLMAKLANAEQAVDHIAAEDRAECDEARRQLESSRRGWQDCIDDLKTTEAERDEARRQLESSRRGWQDCIDDLKTTEAERDALAVTAERLRDWLALALANTYDMGMTTEDRRKLAEAEVFLKETAPPA